MTILLALPLLLAAAAQDDLQQVDNVLFKVPPGWKLVIEGDEAALMPKELSKDCVAMILLVKGEPSGKTAREFSDAWWGRLKTELKVKEAKESDVIEDRAGRAQAPKVTRAAAFVLENGGVVSVAAVVVKVLERAESFLYLSSDAEKADAHGTALRQFVDSLDFSTLRAGFGPSKVVWREDKVSPTFLGPEIPMPKNTAGLHGVWWTADKGSGYNLVTGRYEVASLGDHYAVFLGDGGYYEHRPVEGLANFDLQVWLRRHPLLAGRYALDGGAGVITCRNADNTKDAVYKLKVDGDKVWIADKGPYFRMDPCDGFDLEGTWKRTDHEQERAPQGWGTFRKDGTFEEEGLLYAGQVEWSFERPGRPTVMAEAVPGKGRWKIGRYTLELIYDDGRKRRAFVCRPPNADGGSLTIGRFSFIRMKK